jgi:DNA adenine methylase
MISKILPLIPEHRTYTEPFAGAASLLFAKRPSPVEAINDVHQDLINLYRVMRDPRMFKRFWRLVKLTPYSRAEYLFARANPYCDDPAEQARRWYVMIRQSIFGRINHGWAYSRVQNRAVGWRNAVAQLRAVHERLKYVQIDCLDWREFLEKWDYEDALHYCDPPYVIEARSDSEQKYQYEMSLDDHRELVDRLLALKGQVILSGYEHEVHEPLEKAGWEKRRWRVRCNVGGRTRIDRHLAEEDPERYTKWETAWLKIHRARQLGLELASPESA